MTKKHEELVEKIGQLLEEYERTCADGHYGQVELDQCRQDLSIDAIAFTLSAFRDGLDLEELAALEHEQWMYWSKQVADEVSPETRARWETYWKPYEELSEAAKDMDRIWARKVIALSGTSQRDPVGGKEEEG